MADGTIFGYVQILQFKELNIVSTIYIHKFYTDLNNVGNWCQANQLHFNIQMCTVRAFIQENYNKF